MRFSWTVWKATPSLLLLSGRGQACFGCCCYFLSMLLLRHRSPCSITAGRPERASRKSAVSITVSGTEATFLGLLVCKGDFWSFPDSPEHSSRTWPAFALSRGGEEDKCIQNARLGCRFFGFWLQTCRPAPVHLSCSFRVCLLCFVQSIICNQWAR